MDNAETAVTKEDGVVIVVPPGGMATVTNGGKDLPLDLPPGAYLVKVVTVTNGGKDLPLDLPPGAYLAKVGPERSEATVVLKNGAAAVSGSAEDATLVMRLADFRVKAGIGARMWLAIDIGCLECGIQTRVIGVFADKARAEAVAESCKIFFGDNGQNEYLALELPAPEEIAEGYQTAVVG